MIGRILRFGLRLTPELGAFKVTACSVLVVRLTLFLVSFSSFGRNFTSFRRRQFSLSLSVIVDEKNTAKRDAVAPSYDLPHTYRSGMSHDWARVYISRHPEQQCRRRWSRDWRPLLIPSAGRTAGACARLIRNVDVVIYPARVIAASGFHIMRHLQRRRRLRAIYTDARPRSRRLASGSWHCMRAQLCPVRHSGDTNVHCSVCDVTDTVPFRSVAVAIGVDPAGILSGVRMASDEGGSVPNGVWFGEGCPLSSRLGDLGSIVSSPSGVRGRKRILAYFEDHRTLLFVSIWQISEWDNLHQRPPTPNSGGLVPCVPRDLRPWL